MHSRQTPTLFQSDGLEYSVRSSAHDRALARFADFERAKARFVREVAAAEISAESNGDYACRVSLFKGDSLLVEFRRHSPGEGDGDDDAS